MTDQPQPDDRLSAISQQRERPAQSDDTYSKNVRILKTALPLVAAALTAIVVSWTFISDNQNLVKPAAQIAKAIGTDELLKPRFESVDSNNQPYTITAKRARRGQDNEDMILLESPTGDIQLKSGRWLAMEASEGTYHQNKQYLTLGNGVNIFDDQGYTMKTARMEIDLKDEIVASDSETTGQGPAGNIHANGLFANINEGLLRFKGPATLTLKTDSESGLKGFQ